MHGLEQANAHHLGNPTGIIAVTLVDLLSLEKRLHVPGFDADHRQVRLTQPIYQPLRQWSCLNPNACSEYRTKPSAVSYLESVGWKLASETDRSFFVDLLVLDTFRSEIPQAGLQDYNPVITVEGTVKLTSDG